ncbi:MAG: GspH/FimT family pseudopilin [Novosphingobium sp.]
MSIRSDPTMAKAALARPKTSATGDRPVRARVQSEGGQRGFTLIEALVVLAVVGLVAGLGYPELQRGYTAVESRRARGEIIAGLLEARALALRSNQPVAFMPNAQHTGFVIGSGAARVLSSRARIDAVPARIWFYPDGSATAGRLTLITSDGRTIYAVSRDLGALTETREDAPAALPASGLIGGNRA